MADDAPRLQSMQRAVLETGEPAHDEIRFVVDGRTRHLLFHMEPLRAPTGEIAGITGAAADVTEQKLVQEALAEALMYRDLVVSILGHDLRNPAAAVLMVATTLLRQADIARRSRDGVTEIKSAACRMLEMITSLLDFSESCFRGALPISPVPTDLHHVTRAVVQEVLAANPDRKIDVAIAGEGHGRWDAGRMAQVVSNLLGNAVAYGAPGEPIRVELDGDAEEVRLEISNAGAPIAPELLPAIFEPFRRGAAPSARGLGLGLYIVKQIVKAHGGDVQVRSTAEAGTTFTVRVPRWKSVAPRDAAPEVAGPVSH
jgi:signal transduction histidine kinase